MIQFSAEVVELLPIAKSNRRIENQQQSPSTASMQASFSIKNFQRAHDFAENAKRSPVTINLGGLSLCIAERAVRRRDDVEDSTQAIVVRLTADSLCPTTEISKLKPKSACEVDMSELVGKTCK
jgi:hypothetical protein